MNGRSLDASHSPAPSLARLVQVMLKAGATGFGMGMVGILQHEAVTRRAWLRQEEFADGIALANLLPGPIAVDVAVYVGYRLRGWAGATVSLLALLAPAFAIMVGLTAVYLHYGRVPQVHGIFKGFNAAVVALVLAVAYRTGKSSLKTAPQAALAAAALAAAILHANLILLVLACGVLGTLFLARDARPKPESTP
jgi:chromate transporter